MVLNTDINRKYLWIELTYNKLCVENMFDVESNFLIKNIHLNTFFKQQLMYLKKKARYIPTQKCNNIGRDKRACNKYLTWRQLSVVFLSYIIYHTF